MKSSLTVLILLVTTVFITPFAQADECSHLWQAQLTTDASTPKGLSGDTNAAYATLAYPTDPTLHLVLSSTFQQVRFFSFESYRSRFLFSGEALIDYQLVPADGSVNPFLSGNPDRDQQAYTIDVVSDDYVNAPQLGPNVLRMPNAVLTQTIMMRIYLPRFRLQPENLPRVWAFDIRTGAPRRCPRSVNVPTHIKVPQVIGRLVDRGEVLKFKQSDISSGQNAAIPGYVYALNKMRQDEVTVIRFKAPVIGRDARYYSVCVQNFLNVQTLACAADTMVRVQDDGFVHLAISEDAKALSRAAARGFSTLHFTRARRQAVIGIVYRNILPTFDELYSGDYLPVGRIHHVSEF